jgi:ribonuclease E
MLVQVEKEERGNKGAALTTFVSLAGRYVVLMPNNPRGGGVSRRIEGDDRTELKEALDQLEYPNGMSIIARTAGIGRSSPELQWDLNYLLKLWAAIEGAAKGGKGAYLIYQESSLVIRAIRDYFSHDIGDILIDTDDVYEQAQQFMAHVMPEHAARVKRYRDDAPLFSRFQIEHQIESAYARTVQLPSGGAIVIDHTEALVSVDVNSARSIRGGDIEETATRTNLEAAEEVARQMRLRDLGGLIVIDFIDMEESRNRRDVENRLRDALRQDRARVQFGTISKFGLMEMSRQRLRPALSEGASIPCPRCGGSGHIRDTESSALQILRIIQEESLKDNTASVLCQVPVDVASFLLNEKRTEIAKIELKQRINVLMVPNKTLETPNYRLERLKHDDPRLDNIEASYKMAEEVEDPTSVTRRSQEPTNKQIPIIKGVLPDAPAPLAIPKPVVTKPPAVVIRTTREHAAPQTPTPASAGFFGWLKKLFTEEPATPPKAPAAKPDTRRDGRNGRDANRGAERFSEAQADGRPEGRNEGRGARGEGRSDGGRGGRGGRNASGPREGTAQRERFDTEGRPANSQATNAILGNELTTQQGLDAPRNNERGIPQGERPPRNERGNRNGRGGERSNNAGHIEQPAEGTATSSAQAPGGQRPENQEGSESRGRRGGRGGRGDERGPRTGNAGRDDDRGQAELVFLDSISGDGNPNAILSMEGSQDDMRVQPARREDGALRGERPQETRGQVRGERQGRASSTNPPTVQTAAPTAQATPLTTPVTPSSSAQKTAAAAAPVQTTGMPKVTPYTLPLDNLHQVAQGSGLQWVNSDADRIAAVQAAIAVEPRPVHTARARPAPVEIDQGPLILVETKRDLRNMTLPFEKETVD